MIDPTVETVTPGPVTVIAPLASLKRPAPPVIVLTVVATNPVDVTVTVVVKVVNTLSPFSLPPFAAAASFSALVDQIAVPVSVMVLPVWVNDVKSLCKVPFPSTVRSKGPSEVPVPVAVLVIAVPLVVPATGWSGSGGGKRHPLNAATASTTPERKRSLRRRIPATPCLGPRPSWVRKTARRSQRRAVAGRACGSSTVDGNRSNPPYASLCARAVFLW